MSDFVDKAGRVAIRNALLQASKTHNIVTGHCGHVPSCLGIGVPKGASPRCCALCAYLRTDDALLHAAQKRGADPEELVAEAIGVDKDWIISFLQGFDGDDLANGNYDAFRIGQSLWRLFGDEVEA